MQRQAQSTARHLQPEEGLEKRTHFAEGQPEALVQVRGQSQRARPQLRTRRSQGVGRLARMPALHALATVAAAAHRDVDLRHVRPHPGEFGLVLRLDDFELDVATAPRTMCRQLGLEHFVHVIGDPTPGLRAVLVSRLAARRLGIGLGRTFGERGRLALASTARTFQLLPQS